jgi:hypothetical protein
MNDGMEQLGFFGNEAQINLQKRYYRLWQYLKAHPRLSFVGWHLPRQLLLMNFVLLWKNTG